MDILDDTISLDDATPEKNLNDIHEDEPEECDFCDEEPNDMYEQDENNRHEQDKKLLYFYKNYGKLQHLLQYFNGVDVTDIGSEYAHEICAAYEKCIMNEIKQLAARG